MESTAFMQDSFIVPVRHRVFHFLPGTFHKNPSTYGTEQVLQTSKNVIFREMTVPLTFVHFCVSNTVMFGNEIHNHLAVFMKKADHTAPGFASLVTIPLCTSSGCCLGSRMWLAGSCSKPPASHVGFGAETHCLAL